MPSRTSTVAGEAYRQEPNATRKGPGPPGGGIRLRGDGDGPRGPTLGPPSPAPAGGERRRPRRPDLGAVEPDVVGRRAPGLEVLDDDEGVVVAADAEGAC